MHSAMTPKPASHLPLTHVVYHVLLSLAGGQKHGYGIIKDVEERTGGRVVIEAGTLYGAIKRLRGDRWIAEVEGPAETDERRRYYGLTPTGRAVLRAESERLAELVEAARAAHVLPPAADGRA